MKTTTRLYESNIRGLPAEGIARFAHQIDALVADMRRGVEREGAPSARALWQVLGDRYHLIGDWHSPVRECAIVLMVCDCDAEHTCARGEIVEYLDPDQHIVNITPEPAHEAAARRRTEAALVSCLKGNGRAH